MSSTGFALNWAALALRRAPRVRFQRAWSFVFWDCWAVHVSRAALSENRAVSFASPASKAWTFFSVHWSHAALVLLRPQRQVLGRPLWKVLDRFRSAFDLHELHDED